MMNRTTMNQSTLIQNLQTLLNAHPALKLAILFGSTAKGSARADSDIDIAVLGQHPLTAAEKTDLIEQIANT